MVSLSLSIRLLILASIIATLAACQPSLETRLSELVTSKNLWIAESAGQSYSFEIKAGNQPWKTVAISDPGREPIDWLTDPQRSERGDVTLEPTVRELFELAFHFVKADFEGDGTLEVTYDDQLGFPSAISWDDGAIHGASKILVRNVIFDPQ